MSYFLLIYDRPAGALRELREYAPAERAHAYAERDRLELDKEPHMEVVVLQSASQADIRKSHGAYFYTLAELAAGV